MEKVFYWVKSEKKDFFTTGMQALKVQSNKEVLLFLYFTLYYESIDSEGFIDSEQLEMIAILTGIIDLEPLLKKLSLLKLIKILDDGLLVALVSSKIESIKEDSVKRKERRQTKADKDGQKRTVSKSVQTKGDNVRHKEKEIDKDIKLEKELKLKKEKDIKKEIEKNNKKEKQALLEKDALEIYEFYRSNIKGGSKKNTVSNLKQFLTKHSKDELLLSISNYIYENKKNDTDIKYYKKPENFFSKASEVFDGYLGFDALREDKVKEFYKRMNYIKNEVFGTIDKKMKLLGFARDEYINFLTEEEIETGKQILMGE